MQSCKVSKQTEILDTFFSHTSPVVTRRVLIRAIRRGARKAYERATGLHEDKPDMDSAGIGRDRKWRRLRARSDASRSTNRLLLADQGKEWCKLQMAGVSPVIELSRLVFEVLRKDEEFVLYRGRSKNDSFQVLVLSPVAEYPSPESLKRLDHEYSLRENLDARWTALPRAIARHWGRTVLVLEDPGGVPLVQLLGRPLNLAFSLRLAINLAIAISQLHQRGIIHKDIKPANVLVNSATGQAWLTGFGIASRLPRERQSPKPPEFIAGTLAYMAPEQTGRMNRSIDSRSDLYSLGVTLYEMLTGVLPFDATDPMEWVHCHVARQPPPITERLERIPEAISAIVSKLLAKHAEERYQIAAGLEADLGKCLADWESLERIEPFRLGTCDTPDRLLDPREAVWA